MIARRDDARPPAWIAFVVAVLATTSACDSPVDPSDSGMAPSDANMSEDAEVPVDAPLESCDTPGAMRAVTCGSCGIASEACGADGFWARVTECLGEGCAPGSVDRRAAALCVEETRICTETCEWTDWIPMGTAGECEPGAEEERFDGCGDGESRTATCTDACIWDDPVVCVSPCGGTRRTSPPLAEERCIPEGTFIRGDESNLNHRPVAEIFISAFFIDRYPVTNDRYRVCVDAGACAPPRILDDYVDPGRGDHAIHTVAWPDAVVFCDWDGGRRLPTEAEWEKAGRGPAPRTVYFPWGDVMCGAMPLVACGWDPGPDDDRTLEPVTAHPSAASYYGVELMVGRINQIVADLSLPLYYQDPASRLPDPQGPLTGGPARVGRGSTRFHPADFEVWKRHAAHPSLGEVYTGFRCARSGE